MAGNSQTSGVPEMALSDVLTPANVSSLFTTHPHLIPTLFPHLPADLPTPPSADVVQRVIKYVFTCMYSICFLLTPRLQLTSISRRCFQLRSSAANRLVRRACQRVRTSRRGRYRYWPFPACRPRAGRPGKCWFVR